MTYDYIIVGGGTAGSVLANRLSADPKRHVLLIEAGPDMPHGHIPESLLDSYPGMAYTDPAFTWSQQRITTAPLNGTGPRQIKPYEQGRVLGGSSSINGQLANRGSPEDYDEWKALGASGWGWESVLPYFRRLEHDLDFDGELHGQGGAMPVRRVFPDLWAGHAKATAAALAAQGMPYLPDQNASFEEGYFPLAITNAYERRVSASTAYLGPTVRLRKNLTVLANTEVSRLLFTKTKCTGVIATKGDQQTEFLSHQVILCCGALRSPALLLRSGIGPGQELKDLGIDVLADRPGVGKHLMDHPSVAIAAFLEKSARVNQLTRRHMVMGWRYTSSTGVAENDMFVVASGRSAWHAIGKQLGSMLVIVNKTFSCSGTVTLAEADWRTPPKVDFDLLSDARDRIRLMEGFRRVAALHEMPTLRATTSHAFPAVLGAKARQFGKVNARNRALTALAARMLDGPQPIRKFMMDYLISGEYKLHELLANDDALSNFVSDAAVGGWHASCTCRMGSSTDLSAVTDDEGRVYGVEGLRVVDASIFPTIPRANTNLPVLMIAEKLAESIRTAV